MKAIAMKWQNATGKFPNLIIMVSTLLFLIFLIVLFSSLSPVFLTTRNLYNILNQSSIYLILGVAMTLVLATGAIDISVASMIGLTSAVFGTFLSRYGFSWWVAILACIIAGTLCGAFNGFIIAKFKVWSIIATLATMALFRGLAYLYQGAEVHAIFPPQILWLTKARFLGINFNIYLSIFIFLMGSYFLTKTATGRHLVAIGADKNVAKLSGIKTGFIEFLPFMLMGTAVGIAAIILASRLDSAQASIGMGIEMRTITAVVIGGTLVGGGRALMSGTLIGVFILAVIENGLGLTGINFYLQQIIIGLLFIIVVALRSRREE